MKEQAFAQIVKSAICGYPHSTKWRVAVVLAHSLTDVQRQQFVAEYMTLRRSRGGLAALREAGQHVGSTFDVSNALLSPNA